ncbi:hypothetical protein SAMN06265338_106212 [Rhodoblastus acidophilus]|uniref:Chemotaxis protein MotC n=1 Tax=Rhodoblastus acidophilus TaxID=1074 RepID=A0A212RS62_RHOAC|nr:hypothetical protein [Rhodoblastus acidophilus]PPQ38613.1 hypothetical protein CKO16_10020 [Rhodoblastus acidophilus]RAI16427.1 hypothetical protein CH337_21385 [Rhodoblastus acidophilus]SNB75307.1 hypothetical protein SAMN06265338_106212 [Rhodoblastus acidophilus]
MKIPKLKVSLPKLKLPKLKLPKIGMPKIGLPKIAAPKLSLPKLSGFKFLKRKGKADLEAAEAEAPAEKIAEALEEDGAEKPQAKGRFPKLKGKARVLVPLAGALIVAALGGGGYFGWRMLQGQPAAQGESAASAPQEAEAKAGGEGKDAAPQAAQAHGEGGKPEGHAAGAAAPESKSEGAPEGGGGKQKVVVTPLPPPSPPSEIVTMVRRLQDLQEKTAVGDAAAFVEMPKHLRKLGRAIFEAPPETWQRPDDARALICYLLRGGSSEAGRKALSAAKFSPAEAPFVKAVIAYLENLEVPERDYLLTLDPFALDPTLGPSVAFVQSILLTPRDRAAAVAKLDVARLLAPGGLVEEASLRREVVLLAEDRQYERFASLGRQYWARFRASPYAENFLRQFMLGVARVARSIKLEEWSQLQDFVESLTPETKRNIYLTVAQTASVVGNVDLAAMAASRARDLSVDGSEERQRASVYGALAAVGSADPARSAHLLDDVDRGRLTPADQPLYDAAAYVAGRIFRAPAKGFKEQPAGDANATDADLARAEKLLKDGDAVIASARKTMARER